MAAVGGIDHSEGSKDIHQIDRGVGFERFIATDFDGATEYVKGVGPINTVDAAGLDSFTIQAWFQLRHIAGLQTLLSNESSGCGFSLKLDEGQLCGHIFLAGQDNSDGEVVRGGKIDAGRWYYAAFRVKDSGQFYDLSLFLNGTEVASGVAPHYLGIRQSVVAPSVAAEVGLGVLARSFFDGLIYAVSVTNYAISVENYLLNKTIRDGSRYFGMVSYHDYLDETKGLDHRISDTIDRYPMVNIVDSSPRSMMAARTASIPDDPRFPRRSSIW